MADKIALVGHEAQQVLLLQSHHRLADRGAAALVALGQDLLVDGLAGLEDAVNNVASKLLIDLFRQRASRRRHRR